MNTIKLEYEIDCPPDVLFAALTDFGQLRRWRTLEDIQLEPAGPVRIGTRLFSKVAAMGRTMVFTNEIVELDPAQRKYLDRAIDGTFLIQSSWKVDARSGGSRLVWVTEFQPRGLMVLMTPMMRNNIRQGQLADLAKLKQLLE